MMIAVIVAMTVLLAVGVVGFFADPLQLPPDVLEVLDQRASVVSMFIGAAGLIVAVAALLLQLRAGHAEPATAAADPPEGKGETPSDGSASRERPIAIGGGNSGIVSSGDGARNVQMRAQASGEGRVYQAGGDQTINER